MTASSRNYLIAVVVAVVVLVVIVAVYFVWSYSLAACYHTNIRVDTRKILLIIAKCSCGRFFSLSLFLSFVQLSLFSVSICIDLIYWVFYTKDCVSVCEFNNNLPAKLCVCFFKC